MKKNKISFIIVMQYVFMFLIMLYPFNATIDSIIYPSIEICLASVFIGTIGLLFLKKKHTYTINKKSLMVLIITFIIMLVSLINNYYWLEGREARVILFSIYLFLPFIICNNLELETVVKNIVKLFSYEHMIGTYISILFKDFYKNAILVKLCAGREICVALGNNYHGYMTGFTTNFSTNAIYLSISTLLFFSEFTQKKDKKSLLLFILSLVALFTAGKRAHLIFTIICCLTLYLIKQNKKIVKKYIKLIIIGIVAIFMLVLASEYIPEIANVFNRFTLLKENGDILNGRSELYDLAFDLWDKHLLIGNGWGSFSYYYQLNLYSVGTLSYIDAHNVYIQLLCETGLIGFSCFMLIMIGMFLKSVNLVKKHNNNIMVLFNFSYQLFFLLYCFTGNPLYDPMCYVIYFIMIGYTVLWKPEKEEIK